MGEKLENKIDCHICFLGSTYVGKTSLLNRLISDKFNENEITTCNPKYYEKKIETYNGNCLNVQFWDTAGQEKYRAITNMIYKKADIIILTYAINDKSSYEEIKNYWFNEVNNKSECQGKFYILIILKIKFSNWINRK